MGYYVHIHVCFACDNNEGVATLAAKHLALLPDAPDGCREARWFLESLSKRSGPNLGPKGGLSMWGMVGNHTNGHAFVETLIPFWTELLTEVEGGPFNFEHVLVFVEAEQSEHATAFEISYDEETKSVSTKEHLCPFAWMQM